MGYHLATFVRYPQGPPLVLGITSFCLDNSLTPSGHALYQFLASFRWYLVPFFCQPLPYVVHEHPLVVCHTSSAAFSNVARGVQWGSDQEIEQASQGEGYHGHQTILKPVLRYVLDHCPVENR